MITAEKAQEILGDRQRAYQLSFKDAPGAAVLADLAVFCRANEPCIAVPTPQSPIDIYRTFVNEGRREVYLRIRDHLDRTTEELVEKYTRPAQGAISHDDQTADPA